MSFFSTVTDFLTGGLGSKIIDTVLAQFPGQLSDDQKAAITAAIVKATREHELTLLNLANEQDNEFNSRIKEMEGTAGDLMQFGVIGKVIVFLRGLQRPLWGFAVMVMDFNVFSGEWNLADLSKSVGENVVGTNVESAFWLINFLVLGFLFGERAMKNVLPLLKGINKG